MKTRSVYQRSYQKSYYSHRKRRKQRKIRFLWFFVVMIFFGVVGGAVWFKQAIVNQVPNVTKVEDFVNFAQSSTIVDRNGIELFKLFEENRKLVRYDDISHWVIDAAVATENENFRTDDGLNYFAIFRE